MWTYRKQSMFHFERARSTHLFLPKSWAGAGKVLSTKMLARGAFELASTSRYGAASVLVRARDVLTRHVHSSGAAFDLRTDG
ncbi:hypothetical protein N9M16_01350 [Candidatus Dependentiae bacterium]|nr:hypothetical protein [Candidatus Dependentiae bacterium]